MSSLINTLKKNVRRITKPLQTILGIGDTTLTAISKSKYTPKIIKQPIEKTQKYINTVVQGRNDYPPKARAIIKTDGEKPIKNIKIIRQPIQSFINTAFNVLTFGAFQKKLDELPYDKLFHLRMVIKLEDNTEIQIEKNEVINITKKIDTIKGQEEINIPFQGQLNLNQLLEGGKKILKDKFFTYRAFGNNCQDFQIALLKGSNLLNPEIQNFVKQDVDELATINPYLRSIANTFTDMGGKFNEIIQGTGIIKKHNKNYKVQSVVFDKSKWTKLKAKKWLSENNYKNDDIDVKENTLRFRQFDPKTVNKKLYRYTTHRLDNNIDLIIVYKQSKNINLNNDINMKHSIKAIGGELVHFDFNSHNSYGKSNNKMEGGALDLEQLPSINLSAPNQAAQMFNFRNKQKPQTTTFKPTQKILKSKNALLNNLTSEDIEDLKKLFSEVDEKKVKEKKNLEKTKILNKKRISDQDKVKIITTQSKRKNVRGTIEGKKEALKKYKKKSKK